MTRRKLIAGNWKMNGLAADLAELDTIADAARANPHVDVAICPPATLIAAAAARSPDLAIGAQDCHAEASGAHTGDISAAMLVEAGALYVIVGHSERRTDHGESDEMIRDKAAAAVEAGLIAIVCVGETEAERDDGKAISVVARQLSGSVPSWAEPAQIVIAYEPVWAIGTGRTPTVGQIADMHAAIRRHQGEGVRILYGGSMNAGNAAVLLAVANVDGGLVGGASLSADKFVPIIEAAAGQRIA